MMKHHKWITPIFLIAFFCGQVSAQISKLNPISEPSEKEFAEIFQKGPGRDFSTGPLWTWNDLLTREQVRSTLRDLAAQKIKQVWVHPRPGLMTPYLSDEWFARWKEALDEAKRLDMNIWIYDENSYPSGFAGGFVPDAMPDSRGLGLQFQEEMFAENLHELHDAKDVWYVWIMEKDSNGEETWNTIYTRSDTTKEPPTLVPGRYMVGRITQAGSGPWFGGKYYVDLLKSGVTQKFIEITFDAYKKRFGNEFGKRIPGIFTDEPHLQTAGGLTWNNEIPNLFQKKYGYSLTDAAVSLVRPVGDWKKVRHDYQRLLLDLFVERWAQPCFEWCEENQMQFTGHYWEHGWPGASHGPDNMAMYAWHQCPAIDILMNQYSENVGSQFGNVRSVKELASIANQLGHSRTLCELYGAGGWDLRFEDMKRQADWILALGVNTINEHLSYVTIRGARKRDHPQSFSYHAPWFEGYHVLANRNTRIQYALSQGRQVNRVLILEPTTTAWMYQGDSKLGELGNSFQKFVNTLEKLNVEYDLGSEDIIERLGSVDGKNLVVGKASYDLIVFPPNMENVDSKTLALVAQAAQGGAKVFYFDLPQYVNGTTPQGNDLKSLKILADPNLAPNTKKTDEQEILIAAWNRTADDGIRFVPDSLANVYIQANAILKKDIAKGDVHYVPPAESGKVYHHRRRLGNQDVVFITNISMTESASGWVYSNKDHVDQWDPDTGKMTPYPCEQVGRPYIRFRYELPPCGSLLVVLSGNTRVSNRDNPTAPEVPSKWYFPFEKKTEIVHQAATEPTVRRLAPNVLTLDYMDVCAKGETLKDVYFHKANHWVFEKNGKEIGLTRNPWDNGVQFKDELITKVFPADSGFTATYKFQIAENIPEGLKIVIERADLYDITCNGKPLKVLTGNWWLDKSFYTIDLSAVAKVGENEVQITAKPMSIYHELEPAYLLGDFSLQSAERGFIVCPPKPLTLRTPEPGKKVDTHSTERERVSWLSKGIGFHGEKLSSGDFTPYLVFDLGENFDSTNALDSIKIWNYNEANLTKRGVKEINIYSSTTPNPKDPNRILHRTMILQEGGSQGPQDVFLVEKTETPQNRYIVFEIKSNHGGITYPIAEKDWENAQKRDNAFVGLAEVQFFVPNSENPPHYANAAPSEEDKAKKEQRNAAGIPELLKLQGVKIAAKSSELVIASHDRKAEYILDGSGLEPYVPQQGWNQQGMPFYSHGVMYTERFKLDEINTKNSYFVRLPDSPSGWYGATAKVVVNGKPAGYVMSAPWKVDVKKYLRSGSNRVDVVIFGTPKNLLGPHHSGKTRGTAWPGMFWNGPHPQPSGNAYDTIGYGLFQPFDLVEDVKK